MRVDFSSVPDNDALAPGWHEVTVSNVEDRESGEQSKNPGTPYINVEFTVSDGPSTGRKCWGNFFFTEKSLPILKQFLKAAGMDTDGEVDVSADALVGSELAIKVRHNEFNGKTQANPVQFRKAGSGSESENLLP